MTGLVKRWPPLICRSPFAGSSGLILPEGEDRVATFTALVQASISEAIRRGASFVVFDYLSEADAKGWPPTFSVAQFSDPGTVMQNCWNSLDEYLAAHVNKKNRRHYKHAMQEVDELDVHLDKCKQIADIDAALELIRNVERRHDAFPNPWARAMLENIELVDGTWLDARIGE